MQDAKAYCREIMGAVRQLRQKRDMSINEIKLTLAIEDPTTREKRDYLGIEVSFESSGPISRHSLKALQALKFCSRASALSWAEGGFVAAPQALLCCQSHNPRLNSLNSR